MRFVPIDDAADPRIADYRDLPGGERRDGLFVVEGRRTIRRLLGTRRFGTHSVLATEAALGDLTDALPDGVPVYVASERTISGVVAFDFHGGCLALGERNGGAPEAALLAGRRLLVLERVTNPDNVGGVFRNAMAFGADGVLLSPGCGDPLYRRALRVSMGGTLEVPFASLPDWPDGLARLRAAGFSLVAVTPDGDIDIADVGTRVPLPARVALLLGAEDIGLGRAARAFADLAVTIPMVSADQSLNVATASAIALHRFASAGG